MSTRNINTLLDLWAATLLKHNDTPPYANHTDLLDTIDYTPLGDVPWQSFSLNYNGEFPDDAPSWMTSTFDVWFRDPHLVAKNTQIMEINSIQHLLGCLIAKATDNIKIS